MALIDTIDWAATGAWMQAWAGFAQAGAVCYAAVKATKTFSEWRRQRIEDRRISAAEDISSLLYRVRRAFHLIRRDGITLREQEIASVKLEDSGRDLQAYGDTTRSRIIIAQVVFDRIQDFEAEWLDLAKFHPLAEAFFPGKVSGSLLELDKLKSRIETAALHYPESNEDDLTAEIEQTLFSANESDDFSKSVLENVGVIESDLLPVIRA